MKDRTNEETQLREELNEEIRKLDRTLRQMSPDKRAYCMMKLYMQHDNLTDELRIGFQQWLASPQDEEAKERAFIRCFEESLSDSPPPDDHRSASLKTRHDSEHCGSTRQPDAKK